MKIEHAALYVNDLEAVREFYNHLPERQQFIIDNQEAFNYGALCESFALSILK